MRHLFAVAFAEEFVCIVPGKDGRRRLTAYGGTDSATVLPKATDYESRRKAANHSHY